jgi:hypothetical protein
MIDFRCPFSSLEVPILARSAGTGRRAATFSTVLLGLILGADVRAQSITESSEAHYRPSVDEHRFGLLTDRIISPRDSRFLLEEERGEATIEFYLTRSWPERDDLNNLYCIFYIGGRKAHGRPQSASLDDKAGGGGAPAPGELIDPYAEPTHVIPRAKASEGAADSGLRYWPRIALYASSSSFFVHSGDVMHRYAIPDELQQIMERGRRHYFAVTVREDKILIHCDGILCAQFRGFTLAPWDGVQALSDHSMDQVVLGTRPVGLLGTVETSSLVNQKNVVESHWDLDRWLGNFNGKIGAFRLWGRAFPEKYVSAEKGLPLLAERGARNIARNIAYETSDGDVPPSYTDLICYSDFTDTERSQRRLRLQFPISGSWVNPDLQARLKLDPPDGLSNSYGNVEDVPLICVVRGSSPGAWLVYEGADLIGWIDWDDASRSGEFTSIESRKPLAQVALDSGKLRFAFDSPSMLFGGVERSAAKSLELTRPSLRGAGYTVNVESPFWAPSQIEFISVAFRGFDVTEVDPLRAFTGRTGSARWIFNEPDPLEYRYIDLVAVPPGYGLCPVAAEVVRGDTYIVSSEKDVSDTFSGHLAGC